MNIDMQRKEQSVELLKQLVAISEIDPIPQPCIFQELDNKLQNFLTDSGKTLEEVEKQFPSFKESFAANNRQNIIDAMKSTMVLQEAQKELNIEVTDEEIKAFLNDNDVDKDSNKYTITEYQIRIKKTLKYLVEQSL